MIAARRGECAPQDGRDTMRATVFVGISVDGFLARRNGDLDFLPSGDVEEHGYEAFVATVDAIVIGRGTFEKALEFEAWPYGERRVVVLSSRPLDLSRVPGKSVEQMSGPPVEIVAKLSARGIRHIYVDGGVTIQRFLRAGLIQRLIVTRVPVLIGDGIPLFGALDSDVKLRHVETRTYRGGLVQSEYTVEGSAESTDAGSR
jgi:dihydrofolate reductase